MENRLLRPDETSYRETCSFLEWLHVRRCIFFWNEFVFYQTENSEEDSGIYLFIVFFEMKLFFQTGKSIKKETYVFDCRTRTGRRFAVIIQPVSKDFVWILQEQMDREKSYCYCFLPIAEAEKGKFHLSKTIDSRIQNQWFYKMLPETNHSRPKIQAE